MKKLVLLFFVFSRVLFPQDVFNLLPDSIGTWIKSDSAALYVGEGLYTLIDGGADIFNEYGFDKVLVQRYSDPEKKYIDIEIYKMKDSYAAYGIFSLFTFGTGKRIKDMNDTYEGDQFLLFRKGNFYISFTASGSSDEIRSGMLDLAKDIESRIYGSGKPALVSLFQKSIGKDNPDLRIAFIMGNLGLYNLTTISFGNNFKVEEGICLEIDGVKCLIFSYISKEDAEKNYFGLTGHLKNNIKYHLINSGQYSDLFIKDKKYVDCRFVGIYVVVLDSESKNSIENIMIKIEKVLNQ
jgi:hypothetical protein